LIIFLISRNFLINSRMIFNTAIFLKQKFSQKKYLKLKNKKQKKMR
jgi:hypothetical protein